MLDVRQAQFSKQDNIPQFWMGDYVGLLEGIAHELGIQRLPINATAASLNASPAVPARYQDQDPKTSQSFIHPNETLTELCSILSASCTSARFLAAAAFTAMQGRWVLRRTLTSFLPEFPSGKMQGVAWFHPRRSTDPKYIGEYLYVEEGTLKTDKGFELRASRRYVYRYNEEADTIRAFFVKEDGLTVDYFFNEAGFEAPRSDVEVTEGKSWVANGSHLCEKDMYESRYEFRFVGARLEKWSIKYVVKGPRKDYVSETWFERK